MHHIPIDVAHPAALKADRPTVGKGDSGGPVFSESELQGFVYRLYEQQKNLEAGIEHKESELYKAHAKLAQGDKQIASLRADIGLQTGRIADLEAKQQQLMGDYSGLQIIAAEQKGAIVTFETVLTQRTVELEGLRSDISSRDARIGALESMLVQRDQRTVMLVKEIDQCNHEISTLKGSLSWRVTAPLRAIKRWWLNIVHA